MKKINFTQHVLPHLIAIAAFLIITFIFFKPLFFDNKTLEQSDIQQFHGSAKSIMDYREKTGEEALWADNMFSGMPAYMISVQWGNQALSFLKRVLTIALPHPVSNIFLAFVCYYIMLLTFRVRPYLAIAGAIAFGLSSYMIIGLMAGHNARIGAIAVLPLIMAGIHLVFSNQKILGFGVTTAAVALHLRENHIQITYYFMIIVVVYGVIQLIEYSKQKNLPIYFKNIALLIPAALLAVGSFFGQFWAITEYASYSIRGKSEITKPAAFSEAEKTGLDKEYAFRYSNGILEPLTLLLPNFYGGSTSNSFLYDRDSETFKYIQQLANSGNEQLANQLYNYTISYWSPGFSTMPYYASAIIVFLFVIGILFAERKYMWWLVSISIIGIVLSWGKSFPAFNYFLFDYLPGYNKFRSVTFTIMLPLFAMPLLGLLGVERLWQQGVDKRNKRKLLIAFGITGGLCLLFTLFAGAFDFMKDEENQLPAQFLDVLIADRKSMFRSDAFRSFAFITGIFILLYFEAHKKISPIGFFIFLSLMITIDLAVVDKRYFTDNNYKRERDNSYFAATAADEEILKDKSYYRVYNLQWEEARTSYYHHSVGGYHGAKMRRYQDFYDSCLSKQTRQMITDLQQRQPSFENYSALNMLNIKYIVYGAEKNNVITNPAANGNAWFVSDVKKVNSPTEELAATCAVNTQRTAVVDVSKFTIGATTSDSTATITLTERTPRHLKYETKSSGAGFAVFSEIYYPDWKVSIDGKETPLLRANYILRALEVPAGNHTIEFSFEPKAYTVGNGITMASSWLVLVVLLGSIVITLKKE